MEFFIRLLVMLLLLELKVFESIPIHLNRNQLMAFTKSSITPTERLNYVRAIAIVCLSWILLAAIGWGLYYGCRGKENRLKGLESQLSSSYEYLCCTKIPPSTSNIQSETDGGSRRVQQKRRGGTCCGESSPVPRSQDIPANSQRCKDNQQSKGCCAPQKQTDSTSIPVIVTHERPVKRTKESQSCCASKQKSESECPTYVTRTVCPEPQKKQSKPCCASDSKSTSLEELPRSRTVVTHTQPIKPDKADTQCCSPKKKLNSEVIECQPVSYNRVNYVPSSGPCSKPISKTKEKDCICPCCKKNDVSDLSDRPSTVNQFSQKILQEDVQTVSKSAPKTRSYDFHHIKNASPARMINAQDQVKPQVKEVFDRPIDSQAKLMRPVPAIPVQPLPEKSPVSVSKQSCTQTTLPDYQYPKMPLNQPAVQKYILIQPQMRLNPRYEQKCDNVGGLCCSSLRKEKVTSGNIHPIIGGYQVQGHVRVKGQGNKESITIPEDTYDVFP